jgi:hypothetical protein
MGGKVSDSPVSMLPYRGILFNHLSKFKAGKLDQWGDRTLSQMKKLFYKLLKNDICSQTLMIQDTAIVVS